MKLLLVAVFSSLTLSILAQCDDHFNACEDLPDIATITCKASGTEECSIEIGAGNTVEDGSLDYLLGDPKIKTINAEECRKKCKEQAATDEEKECKFFKWMDKDHEDHPDIRCALQTECGVLGDAYCYKPGCESGQLGCDENGNEIKDCSLSAKTAWGKNNFHIICTDTTDGDVNIYDDETYTKPIAGGTICSTVRMCDTWADVEDNKEYYRKLAVVCNGTEGVWKPVSETGSTAASQAMIEDGPKIVEPECNTICDPLTLTKYLAQPWADLICDSPLTEAGEGGGLVLKEPNSCILLCDNHLKMSVDCGFTGNGEKHWHDGHGANLDADDDIKCGA